MRSLCSCLAKMYIIQHQDPFCNGHRASLTQVVMYKLESAGNPPSRDHRQGVAFHVNSAYLSCMKACAEASWVKCTNRCTMEQSAGSTAISLRAQLKLCPSVFALSYLHLQKQRREKYNAKPSVMAHVFLNTKYLMTKKLDSLCHLPTFRR